MEPGKYICCDCRKSPCVPIFLKVLYAMAPKEFRNPWLIWSDRFHGVQRGGSLMTGICRKKHLASWPSFITSVCLGIQPVFQSLQAQQSPGSRSVQSPQMVCNISYGAGTVPALSTHWLWQGTDINKTQISMSQAGLLWGEGRIIHTLWKVEGWGAIFTSVSTTKTVNKLLISVTCDKRVRK